MTRSPDLRVARARAVGAPRRMIQPMVAAAVIATMGGVVAIAARDGQFVALGLLVAMVASPFAASPQPPVLAIVFRVLGSLLAAESRWATRVKAVRSDGSAIGLAAETAIAAAAFLVGLWIAPVKPLLGPVLEQAAGLAFFLAVIPLIGRDVLRVGAGAALLAVGLSLLHEAWLGPAQSFDNLALAALLVGILGATGLLIAPAAGVGGDADLGRSVGERAAAISLQSRRAPRVPSRAWRLLPRWRTLPGPSSPTGGPGRIDGQADQASSRRATPVILIAFFAVCAGGAALAQLTRPFRRLGPVVGLAGLAAACATALLIGPADGVTVGYVGLAGSTYAGMFLAAATAAALLLCLVGLESGWPDRLVPAALAAFGGFGVALTATDPRVALVAAAAAAATGAVVSVRSGTAVAEPGSRLSEARTLALLVGSLLFAATVVARPSWASGDGPVFVLGFLGLGNGSRDPKWRDFVSMCRPPASASTAPRWHRHCCSFGSPRGSASWS